VVNALADGLNWSLVARQAAQAIMGPQIYEGQATTQGGYLGLGLSWTVLSLVNSYCARQAGPYTSYSICGDDLVAAWTASQRSTYQTWLGKVGLRPQTKKEYMGEQGVFCERVVKRVSPSTYEARQSIGLAEASGSHGDFGGINTAGSIADLHRICTDTRTHHLLRRLAQRAKEKKGGNRNCKDLPIKGSINLLAGILAFGVVPVNKQELNPAFSELRRELSDDLSGITPPRGAKLADVLVTLTAAQNIKLALEGEDNDYRKEAISIGKHKGALLAAEKRGKARLQTCTIKELVKTNTRISAKQKHNIFHSLSISSSRGVDRAIRIATRRKTEWVNADVALEALAEMELPTGLTLQNHKVHPPRWALPPPVN
jgi:hypothetical protein